MPKDRDNDAPPKAKRSKNRIWLAAIVVALVAMLTYHLLTSHSTEQKLAAIDATHAIPDSENAAIIYADVFTNYPAPQLPGNFDWMPNSPVLLLDTPWRSNDNPELAKWIEQRQDLIGRLLEASRLDKCWFPITDNTPVTSTIAETPIIRAQAARQWARLLTWAANKDMAEGRTQNAVEKYRAVMQLGRHFCQQPVMSDFLMGSSIEGRSVEGLTRFVVQDMLTESQIRTIESFLPQPQMDWDKKSAALLRTQRLFENRVPLIIRTKYWLQRRRSGYPRPDDDGQAQELHMCHSHLIARYRVAAIAIALRRHKNNTGKWAENLEEIKSLAPADAFIDPINGDPFAYKLAGDTFKLYSKGQNKIDEDGQHVSESDPNTHQVIVKEDDILFWPPFGRILPKEKANTQPPDPNAKESE